MDIQATYNKKSYFSILFIYKFIGWIFSKYQKYFYNIKIGKQSIFIGIAHFYRHKNSSILIGEKCTFRSSSITNLIGINRPCILSTHSTEAKIIIGNGCGLSGTVIGSYARIELKNNVRCGANTLITDFDWHLNDPRSGKAKPILIEDNVWLGEGVKILKGVTIGKNSVIGAGSIVTQNIPENVIAAGNPCKIIKELNINA